MRDLRRLKFAMTCSPLGTYVMAFSFYVTKSQMGTHRHLWVTIGVSIHAPFWGRHGKFGESLIENLKGSANGISGWKAMSGRFAQGIV